MKPLIPWFEVPIFPIPIPGYGTFPLHGFGILVAIGFWVGGTIAQKRAARMGDDPQQINKLIGWLVVGALVGGHVGYGLMYEPDVYLKDPKQFLYFWHGLSSMGGFFVCVPLAIYFFISRKMAVWRNLDHLAHGMAIGWFFGRMGCFVAHDHPGTVTNFYLGVYGICHGIPDQSVACHDMGLYEALWSFTMFLVLQGLDRLKLADGLPVLIFGLSYGPTRFAMDFLRPEATDARYAGFTPGQYGAALFTLLCIGMLVSRIRAVQGAAAKSA